MRFSVKALLILVTFVGTFLSYSQWRRQSIWRQVEEIRQLGGGVELSNDYRDLLWQRRPTKGQLTFGPWPDFGSYPRMNEG